MRKLREVDFPVKHFARGFGSVALAETCYWQMNIQVWMPKRTTFL